MSWRAQLLAKEMVGSRPVVQVLFTDDISHKQVISIDLTGLDEDGLRANVEARRVQMEATYTLFDNLDVETFELVVK